MLQNNLTYRKDIDGLRAVAVLSVVLYHIFASIVPGGFVGVDIFFVISGYLISKHILIGLETGKFSLKDFYTRRIRRILPAFLVFLFVIIIASILILAPPDLQLFARKINVLQRLTVFQSILREGRIVILTTPVRS